MAENHHTERTLFLNALDYEDRDAQQAYLESRCSDPELRKRVESLLDAHSSTQSPLQRLGFAETAESESDRESCSDPRIAADSSGAIGDRVGPYVLQEQIGEGGFGKVYLALQEQPVRRLVAMKVIKAGMDTRELIARFEAERQALALMDHPNVAKVLDAGSTATGRPFFVMELVQGTPITDFCDEHTLTTRERLLLFRDACHGVQHAHHKGIIHRDLKPSNILVTVADGKPIPKVIDFGIAKALNTPLTDKSVLTGAGQLVGTPLYMSPEQAALSLRDVDTRTDVYSLGVLLYELLTGTTPFDRQQLQAARLDALQQILNSQDPLPPSARLRALDPHTQSSVADRRQRTPHKLSVSYRGELDWIVMKAVEKQRNRRYESPSALAADLQRYLDNHPVQARPPSMWYRAQKFARRHQTALTMTFTLALASLLTLGSIGWNIRDRTLRRQNAARDRAARQLRLAGQVEQMLADANQHIANEQWIDALASAKRAEAAVATAEPDQATAAQVASFLSDLELVLKLEEARTRESQHTPTGWNHTAARQMYERTFGQLGIELGSTTVDEFVVRLESHRRIFPRLASALIDWARLERKAIEAEAGKSRDGDTTPASWTLLLQVCDVIDKDSWRQRLRQAFRASETAPQGLRELTSSVKPETRSASNLVILARLLKDQISPEAAAQFLLRVHRHHPGDFWINLDTGHALLESDPPRIDEAVEYFRAAAALYPHNAAVLNSLGLALCRACCPDEGISYLRRAVELHPRLAYVRVNLGVFLRQQGQLDEAVAQYRKAIDLNTTEYVAPQVVMLAYSNLGTVLKEQGKVDEALLSFQQALEIDSNVDWVHRNLGMTLTEQDELPEALQHCRKAVELNSHSAPNHANLGDALLKLNQLSEAEDAYRKAIELDPNSRTGHTGLGNLLAKQGQLDAAISYHRKAVEIAPDSAKAHCFLGHSQFQQQDYEDAIASARKALELNPDLGAAHNLLGIIWMAQRNFDAAIDCFHRALECDPGDALVQDNIGIALRAQGKWEEAVFAHRAAIQFDPRHARSHQNLGIALHRIGESKAAIAALRRSIELDPHNLSAHVNLGAALMAHGDTENATETFRSAVRINPKSETAWYNLVVALKRAQQLEQAEKVLVQAIEHHPESAPLHEQLASVYLAQGDSKKATAAFQNAADMNPPDSEALATIWEVVRFPGADDAMAQRALDRAVQLAQQHPCSVECQVHCGAAMYRLQQWEQAAAMLESATVLNGGLHEKSAFFLPMAYWKVDRKSDALSEYWIATRWLETRRASIEQERIRDEAETVLAAEAQEELYTQNIEAEPGWPGPYQLRAAWYVRRKRFDEAAQDYSQALKLSPHTGDPWQDSQTDLMLELMEHKEIVKRLRELRPDDLRLTVGRVNLAASQQRWEDAEPILESVIEPHPSAKTWCRMASLQFQLEDDASYKAACRQLLERCEAEEDKLMLSRCVLACLLGRERTTGELQRLQSLADRSLAVVDESSEPTAWLCLMRGLVSYRADELFSARIWLQEALEGEDLCGIAAQLTLAMTHLRSGHRERGQENLSRAAVRLEELTDTVDTAFRSSHWPELLLADFLRVEAEQLFETAQSSDDVAAQDASVN